VKVAGRIQRVLTGHSPVALLHAVTHEGHEIKLEVDVGDVLVIDWHAFPIADAPAPASTETESADASADADEAAELDAEEDSSLDPNQIAPTPGAMVRRILGLA